MRFFRKHPSMSVRCVTGTYVVSLGMDMTKAKVEGLLGFAIHRTDPIENEAYWLQGLRTFEETFPDPQPGALISTDLFPIQDFLWSDFTAKPGRKYIYRVQPVYGTPKSLDMREGVEIEVQTEKEAGTHSIFFNRGVIGSQAYSRKFGLAPNKLPEAKRKEAYQWLSRNLEESLLKFIRRGAKPGFGLRAAIYEFSYEPVAEAFQDALTHGQDVQIVYDSRVPTMPKPDASESTVKAWKAMKKRVGDVKNLLKKYGLTEIAIPRTKDPRYIAHNKFIVLLKDGKPIEVWTGSTNMTESGIFGHANVGHVLRDKKVAAEYLDYWERLSQDPEGKDLRSENDDRSPTITSFPPDKGVTCIFSPRTNLSQLEYYANALGKAKNLTCFTAAFGVNELFLDQFGQDKDYLRYVFLEKWGVTAKSAEEAEEVLNKDKDIQVAVGAIVPDGLLDSFLDELKNPISRNIKFVHTKFLLIDPLSDDPIVVTGSANFSDASTKQNDENMVVIRGDTRVADIFFGEFMRLWRHHRFRSIVNRIHEETGEVIGHNYLDAKSKWYLPFFKSGTVKFLRRTTFS